MKKHNLFMEFAKEEIKLSYKFHFIVEFFCLFAAILFGLLGNAYLVNVLIDFAFLNWLCGITGKILKKRENGAGRIG